MWWCCGKTGKDAIGCKITKHFTKEEEDEDPEKVEEIEESKKLKKLNIRCSCCK
jgi:hypothetical protein